ncbi:MAG: 4Fe-4S dicluster domain-containing protein [Spirochaetaceae bacterium]|jgi:Pyruvate/2-oxoacid:ferredoxin oxidoreductase delta subunit|nr:4Fe-4S dicluster domain-containing protein [Spirochaetaceae bacterium]
MAEKRSVFHSVVLDEPVCKGCTVCVTTCPVEAIRVRGGKARILEKRCIDCGECIRRCPSYAKKAPGASLDILREYDRTVALPAPTLYGQFGSSYSPDRVRQALINLGFSGICDAAAAAGDVSAATAEYLGRSDIQRPVISSSCPVIIKLIQIRFPTLLEHLLPVLPPMEAAALAVREQEGPDTGIFFISPCPSKITAVRSPAGYGSSCINGVFTITDLYLPLLGALKHTAHDFDGFGVSGRGYNWARSGGEIASLLAAIESSGETQREPIRWVSAEGIDQSIRILEAIEDGKLGGIDFVELSPCAGGCVGGALTVTLPPLAEEVIRRIGGDAPDPPSCGEGAAAELYWTEEPAARPALLLDPDYNRARKMMEEMELLYEKLPGLDCGSCGAPNCHALAEDIVRGDAVMEDCVHILREHYETLILGRTKK